MSARHANGAVLAFIGEPTRDVRLGKSSYHVNLGHQLVGSWYVKTVRVAGSPPAVSAALLTWREGADTYAIYETGMMGLATVTSCQDALVLWAKTMAETHIKNVVPLSETLTGFDNVHVNPTTGTGGRLISQKVSLAPPHHHGYTDRGGIGYRVTSRSVPVTSSTAPPWPQPTSGQPSPVLGGVMKALQQEAFPVYLPQTVPFKTGFWPRLTLQSTATHYLVDIQTSTYHLPLNTPYEVGQGLGSWYGTVGGSTKPFSEVSYGPTNATPVPAGEVTRSSLKQFVSQHSSTSVDPYYSGIIVLAHGIRAHLSIMFAGDGDHTRLTFKIGRDYYEVSNYHHAIEAIKMAESMIRLGNA